MGGGSWTTSSYETYTSTVRGMSLDEFATKDFSVKQMYKAHQLSKALNPYQVRRECHDSEEHPNTLPVILALDVTGSMGDASVKVAKKLNEIMTDLYADDSIKDIEFCIMGIGDIAYDNAPIQISQFESDIRIAEQLDQIYFEGGGGGNHFESYTAAWYMGVNHCDLDCWKRGQKGIIITMGDELPNPYLPRSIGSVVDDRDLQGNVETSELIEEAREKFDLYHISVKDNSSCYTWYNDRDGIDKHWQDLLGKDNYFVATLDGLSKTIVEIIKNRETAAPVVSNPGLMTNENHEVIW